MIQSFQQAEESPMSDEHLDVLVSEDVLLGQPGLHLQARHFIFDARVVIWCKHCRFVEINKCKHRIIFKIC